MENICKHCQKLKKLQSKIKELQGNAKNPIPKSGTHPPLDRKVIISNKKTTVILKKGECVQVKFSAMHAVKYKSRIEGTPDNTHFRWGWREMRGTGIRNPKPSDYVLLVAEDNEHYTDKRANYFFFLLHRETAKDIRTKGEFEGIQYTLAPRTRDRNPSQASMLSYYKFSYREIAPLLNELFTKV